MYPNANKFGTIQKESWVILILSGLILALNIFQAKLTARPGRIHRDFFFRCIRSPAHEVSFVRVLFTLSGCALLSKPIEAI